MRRREMRQMESLGKGQACVCAAEGRQDGREREIRPQGLWAGVTQNERKTLDLGDQSNLDSTLQYNLCYLRLLFNLFEPVLSHVNMN